MGDPRVDALLQSINSAITESASHEGSPATTYQGVTNWTPYGGTVITNWNRIDVGVLSIEILKAIEPLIEQKGSSSSRLGEAMITGDGRVVGYLGYGADTPIGSLAARIEAAEDRIGDLESWRESTRERISALADRVVDLEEARDTPSLADKNEDEREGRAISPSEGPRPTNGIDWTSIAMAGVRFGQMADRTRMKHRIKKALVHGDANLLPKGRRPRRAGAQRHREGRTIVIVASSMIAPWQAELLVYLFALRVVSLILFGRRGPKW